MTDLYDCWNCTRRYRADKISNCPNCMEAPRADAKRGGWESKFLSPAGSQAQPLDPTSIMVEAQDRTTHAVRSVAVLFFYSIFWSFIVSLLFVFSIVTQKESCDYGICFRQNTSVSIGFAVLALVAAIIGIWVTLSSGIEELRKSRTGATRF